MKKVTYSIYFFILLMSLTCYLFYPAISDADQKACSHHFFDKRLDSFDAKEMELKDVLRLIAQKTEVNILWTPEANGKISFYGQGLNFCEMLTFICKSHDLAFMADEDYVKVMTGSQFKNIFGYDFGVDLQTKMIKVISADVHSISSLLQPYKGKHGRVSADKVSQTLILTDEARFLEDMIQIIHKIDKPIITETVKLEYALVKDVAEQIKRNRESLSKLIHVDDRTNTVVLRGTIEDVNEITHMIKAFDQPDPEVSIEAKIIQVTLSDEYKMGIDWEVMFQSSPKGVFNADFDVLSSIDKRGTLSLGTIGEDRLTGFVEWLSTIGHTELLSSPKVTTLHNKEAKMLVGSTQPYVTSSTITPSTGPTTTSEAVNFIEVGVKLYVTPQVHHNLFVTMKIKPEVSSVIRNITTASNNFIPVIETSEAETTVRVRDRTTLIIGGLVKSEDIYTQKKVPIVGDIPIVGSAFRNIVQSTNKTEIVILLTPHILQI